MIDYLFIKKGLKHLILVSPVKTLKAFSTKLRNNSFQLWVQHNPLTEFLMMMR